MAVSDKWWAEAGTINLDEAKLFVERFITERYQAAPDVARAALMEAIAATSAGEEDEEDPFEFETAADLIANTPEPPTAIAENVLPANKLIILSGQSKFGKSYLVLDLLARVAAGDSLWGAFDTGAAGRVAYYSMEDGRTEAKARLMKMSISDATLDRIHICCAQRFLSDPVWWQRFTSMIEGLPEPPKIVVIDTMREAYQISDWNDQAKVPGILRPIRRWAQKNCTVILIHHNNKSEFAGDTVDRVAGSGAIVSSCDGVLLCTNKKELENGDLQGDVRATGRSGMHGKYTLRMDTNTLRWRLVTDEEKTRTQVARRQEQMEAGFDKIIQAIDSLDGQATRDEIAGHIGLSKRYVTEVIGRMVDLDWLFRIGERKPSGGGRSISIYAVKNRLKNGG